MLVWYWDHYLYCANGGLNYKCYVRKDRMEILGIGGFLYGEILEGGE
jgi:hypothetical protein